MFLGYLHQGIQVGGHMYTEPATSEQPSRATYPRGLEGVFRRPVVDLDATIPRQVECLIHRFSDRARGALG